MCILVYRRRGESWWGGVGWMESAAVALQCAVATVEARVLKPSTQKSRCGRSGPKMPDRATADPNRIALPQGRLNISLAGLQSTGVDCNSG
jgi:hypothetical protein